MRVENEYKTLNDDHHIMGDSLVVMSLQTLLNVLLCEL